MNSWHLRLAGPEDVPGMAAMIPLSVRRLSEGFYDQTQIEQAIIEVFGVDTRLIDDGTYFVVEQDGAVVGCGGWSRRRTLYGGDQAKAGEDLLLDPLADAARIRAFFVHPEHARRGIGSALMEASEAAAREAGFKALELMATLPGVPLYRQAGFEETGRHTHRLGGGVVLPLVSMRKDLVAITSTQ